VCHHVSTAKYFIHNILVIYGEIMENLHMILNEKQVKMRGQCTDGRMTLKEVLGKYVCERSNWV
jgi:hypothetical protein